jgi:hypothetical protein
MPGRFGYRSRRTHPRRKLNLRQLRPPKRRQLRQIPEFKLLSSARQRRVSDAMAYAALTKDE